MQRRLTLEGSIRRVGIIDGSYMGGHYLVAAMLSGQINYPVLTEPCKGRGHELKTTEQLLPIIHKILRSHSPTTVVIRCSVLQSAPV